MDKKSGLRRAAILWFIASALALTAAVLRYLAEGHINWPLAAATVSMALVGFSSWRRSTHAKQ